MKCLLYIVIFISLCGRAQNLVTNGSFEAYTNIDCGTGDISALNNWYSISSPDYYNVVCGTIGTGIPQNQFGNQVVVNGNAYVGIACYYKTVETKEYLYQHLSTSLISGKSYYVSFYVSRAERLAYSIKNIGVYFSVSQPTVSGNTFLPASPQVENQSTFLSDTTNWMKIQGYFTATGGEQYITIGNFNSDANTDTLCSGSNNPIPSDPGTSYYYIDSVSLYDSITVGIDELHESSTLSANILPSPNSGSFTVKYDLGNEPGARISIYDVNGRIAYQAEVTASDKQLSVSSDRFGPGIYYYSILTKVGKRVSDKFVVIK